MSRTKSNTRDEFVSLMIELSAINPDRARMFGTLIEVQAVHKDLTPVEQSTMFLSAIAARQPWMLDEAAETVHGFYDKLAATEAA